MTTQVDLVPFFDIVGYRGAQHRIGRYIADQAAKESFTSFVETPSGSNTIARHVAPYVQDLRVNDMGYWSNCLAMAMFMPNTSPRKIARESYAYKLEEIGLEDLDIELVLPSTWFVLAAVGSVIHDKLLGVEIVDVQSSLLAKIRALGTLAHPMKRCTIGHEDHSSFLSGILGDSISLTYSDFAWPWTDGRPCDDLYENMYRIEEYLTQMPAVRPEWWTKDNIYEHLERIFKEVKRTSQNYWLSTQSTNYPPIDDLEKFATEMGFTVVESMEFGSASTRTGETYQEYLLKLRS